MKGGQNNGSCAHSKYCVVSDAGHRRRWTFCLEAETAAVRPGTEPESATCALRGDEFGRKQNGVFEEFVI